MRLICPNCDAEYLVDASAIPDAGRDVQCSNCGHAWFQLPPEIEAMLAEEEALFGTPPEAAADLPASEPDPAPQPAPDPVAESVRRNLDESILAVLREEAEREVTARRAEAPPIEAQVEMGLSAPVAATDTVVAAAAPQMDATARRLARLKGLDPDARPVPPPKPGSRRELLPDIEEINSSLKPARKASIEDDHDETPVTSASSGFRSGFLLVLIVAAILVAVYVMAPKIAEQIPAAKGTMDAYVAQADALRLWLDGVLRDVTALLRSVTGQSAP